VRLGSESTVGWDSTYSIAMALGVALGVAFRHRRHGGRSGKHRAATSHIEASRMKDCCSSTKVMASKSGANR